jgi:hypothetical protein
MPFLIVSDTLYPANRQGHQSRSECPDGMGRYAGGKGRLAYRHCGTAAPPIAT